jgi:hypothetical protein
VKTHYLKCWPEPFRALVDGRKKYEIRVNDRDYAVGDTLALSEWSPSHKVYSGHQLTLRVTYMTDGGEWGLADNLCVMSVEEVKP